MKAFFSKIWLWALANKVIAIALVLCLLFTGCRPAEQNPPVESSGNTEGTTSPDTQPPVTEADGETTIELEETTVEPEETTTAPEETTTAPEETTTAPEETTTAPEETTTAPEETTTAPEETTTAPEETTTAPEEATTAPEETTTAPEETTTAPEETTTAPEETTATPEETTAAPEKLTATITDVQDLSKTYDATAVANPTFTTDSDGTAAIEWYKDGVKLSAAPKDAGDYVVKILIPETDEYKAATAEKAFTVTKRPIWAQNTEFVYDGSENFCGDEYPVAVLQNVVAGDTVELCDITWYFDSKNVGATLVEVDLTEEYNPNYVIDFDKCSASIVPKTLNYLEITKVYDGEGVLAYALGTEHGVVAGDTVLFYCDEAPDYIVGTYKLIPYDDPTTIDDSGADDRALLAGADKANYKFAERIEGKYKLCATIIVTKRPIWTTGAEFTYDGSDYWSGEESPKYENIVFHNVVPGETIGYDFVWWEFEAKDVGSALISVTFIDEDDGRSNYELDLSKCSASIIPKVIDNLTYAFEYSGMEYHQAIISKNEHSDIVGTDQISLEVCFATPNVGAALDISEETGFEPGFVEANYVLGTTYEFSIIPREIWITGAQFYYDGYATQCDDVAINGITIHNAATTEDESYMGGFFNFLFEDSDVGSNLENVTLGLEKFSDNYVINVSECEAEIVPMELTNLKVQITASTFEEGYAYLNADNGIAHGDKVYIVWDESGHANVEAWKERGSDLVAPHTGMAIQGQAQVTLAGKDANNYTLVITNNKYGTMTYSEKCKPDVFGDCACGTNHVDYTFNSADTVANVPIGLTWEGGIYALNTTTPGYWSIKPDNENCCTVTVYNPHGYKVTMKGSEFYAATAGTYYVHIAKKAEPASGDTIKFLFAYALEDNNGSYDSLKVNCVSGSYYYFKIDADTSWGASLNVNDGNGAKMDSAKYTVKIHDQDFNEMTGVIYDGLDIYKESDDDFTVTDKVIYIQITVNVDTELWVSAF